MKNLTPRVLIVASLVLAGVAPLAPAQVADNKVEQALVERAWSNNLWDTAKSGDETRFADMLTQIPGDDPAFAHVRQSALKLSENLAKREADRAKRLAEVNAELDKALAAPETDSGLSKALASAVELHMLSKDKHAVLEDPRIKGLIERADRAARAAEARGDWLACSELFFRLDTLLEDERTYRPDSERQSHRLGMLRLYVPERLWELRNQRQLADKKEALPPYNPVGDDYREKLGPIDKSMVERAVWRAGDKHVDQVQLRQLLIGGLDSVKTMTTTTDLQKTFSGLADQQKRDQFISFLDNESKNLKDSVAPPDITEFDSLMNRLLQANRDSVNIMDQAVLHEFGNGAMEELDPFSAIIWPDELARFNRSTRGSLIGIGVEIQYDEVSNIRVVTPLEGGPAVKAGIRAGDVIKKIDGKSAVGLTLDQAVDVITGPEGTKVTLTMERKDPAKPADAQTQEIDFTLTRAEVELKSVKGWRREGAKEDDWDWFIDPVSKIGYTRVTGFQENTTREFDRAIKLMKNNGLQGLILDLRFNPGGLLDQAVSIVNRFIDRGIIVMTQAPGQRIDRQERARPGTATLNRIPVVVLVNEGAASASEIVSGALQHFAKNDSLRVVVLGARSYGKGSVQDVTMLGAKAAMKLTTQYYLLPDGRIIHRKPGAEAWGVEPNLTVDMLPTQISDSLTLRRNADLLPLDENGKPIATEGPKADPSDLLTKGLDVQLQAAVVLLQSQVAGLPTEQAARNPEDPARR